MQSHAKSFTRIEPDWTVREGVELVVASCVLCPFNFS